MSQNNQNNDNSLNMLFIMGILMLAFIFFQIWFGENVAWLYTKVRWAYIKFITFFWEKESLMNQLHLLESRHVREFSSSQLSEFSSSIRLFLFPIWGSLVGWYGWKAIKKNPGQRFKKVLDREKLARQMSVDFPWTLPALSQDIINESIDEGKWAMAFNPLEFCRHYGLLNSKSLDTKRAEKLFASQLGKLWTTPDRLNKYTKALFGCFAAQVCRDKDGADAALRQLAISVSKGTPDFTLAFKLVEKYKDNELVVDICNKHAYQYTVLIALFAQGKKIGIFPPNHFLWLRPVNRPLWYVLNCVMRNTYFSEVSGVYSHYLAEKVAGHKIEVPYVNKAVQALEIALRDIEFDPEPEKKKE